MRLLNGQNCEFATQTRDRPLLRPIDLSLVFIERSCS